MGLALAIGAPGLIGGALKPADFTGGSTNPFISFYLLTLTVAAATLPRRHTWLIAATTVSLADAEVSDEAAQAGRLGLIVVAEGIEDSETAALMTSAGCDVLQGFLILPPVPPQEFLAWLRRPQLWSRSLPQQGGVRSVAMTVQR